MDKTLIRFFPALIVSIAILSAAAAFIADGEAQETSTIDLVAIDVVTEGNDATTLGPLDGCVEAEAGSEVAIDVVVDAVPEDRPAIAFQLEVVYDPELLEVTAVDTEFLLAAVGTYQPVEGLTDEVPDSDGRFTVAVLDAASNVDTDENMETGPGVIARVTLAALAEGVSTVEIGFVPPDVSYPAILSVDNMPTQVDNIGSASVSTGEPCPADAKTEITALPSLEVLLATPEPEIIDPSAVPEPEGGGIDYGLLAGSLAIAGVGVVVAAGGLVYYRRKPGP